MQGQEDPATLRVLGFAGSLRQDSLNRALLRAAQELAPAGMEIHIFDLTPIPFFNVDVEAQGDPEPVVAFKQAIRDADALLIATPEYNLGMPGVLKNAIDWASRPPRNAPLRDKPIGIMGATPGMGGTIRAQMQVRQAFIFTQSYALLQPEILISRAHDKFDEEGRLADESTRKYLGRMLEALRDWTHRLAR